MSDAKNSSHPRGLYRLFFIEMWERLAFYTMLNVLLLYATDSERGGLGLTSAEGNEIYGLYLAFVYFTPFPGGMLADRYLGYRKAVVIGALLMATGLFLMSVPGTTFFVTGLVSLIIGNGFFKPNISVMVGNLYEAGDPRRDSGFNIFYMGINIGAFVASFLSSGVRNSFGWLWTFRAAGLGLLVGLVILFFSWKVLERADRSKEEMNADDDDGVSFGQVATKILVPAIGTGLAAFFLAQKFYPSGQVRPADIGFLVGMIPVIVFFLRLPKKAEPKERAGLRALIPIYIAGGTFFMVLHLNGSAMTQWARDTTSRDVPAPAKFQQEALPSYYTNAAEEVARPDPRSLVALDDETTAKMFGQQRLDSAAVARISAADPSLSIVEFEVGTSADALEGERKATFARAAAVYADGVVTVNEGSDSHGAPTVSVDIPDGAKPERMVAFVREVEGKKVPVYVLANSLMKDIYEGYETKYGHPPELLAPGVFLPVINPELYQSLNALFVVAFTPLIVLFFGARSAAGREVTAGRKIFYGLLLTTASLVLMAVAGMFTDGDTVKVSGLWLAGFYAIITTGELCLSPIGLSLVTKLTPTRLVGLAMGGWFMATAFGNKFSGFFGGIQHTMSPVSFFLTLAGLAAVAALYIRIKLPSLDAAIAETQG